jgi:hypothetical protein
MSISDPTFAEQFRTTVQSIARASYLRRLELNSPALQVRMELLRTEPRIDWSGSEPSCSGAAPRPLAAATRSSEGIALSPRDEYTLRFTNDGTEAAYIVVLDLQPNGKISQIFPLPEAEGSDNLLPSGRSYVIQDICFFAEEPFGVEVLKLFATRERVDFAPILTGAPGQARSHSSPLEQLFADAYAGLRGALQGPAGAATTYGITVNVVPSPVVPRRRMPR